MIFVEHPVGVINPDEAAIISIYANGLKSRFRCCAAAKATGNIIVTAALFVIANENTVVAMYVHVMSPNCKQLET